MAPRHPFNVALGAQLEAVRKAKGLSLYAIEQVTDHRYRSGALSAYERGERGMRIATLAELCRLYGTPIAVVLHRAEEQLDHQEAAA